jgi:ABC-type molybdate transport system substrate-binding protein
MKTIFTRKTSKGALIGALGLLCALSAYAKNDDDETRGHDYRTFHSDGKIELGKIGDSYTADLVVYLAGNQFMVMEDLMKDFQKKNPKIKTIYVETIPPGQIVTQQLLKQGEVDGQKTNQTPDIYGSVSIDHLKELKTKEMMDQYMTYTHNRLALMVAKGNPKGVKGPKDLGRDDLVQSHPNPLTEGIFKFYGSQMLKDLGLYDKVTGGKQCKECWAVEGKTWFTDRHHRDTPTRIEKGQADVGIVWTSEVVYNMAEGRQVEGVEIPDPYNMKDKAGYVIGIMSKAKNKDNAQTYIKYLETKDAQAIYAKHGFAEASSDELKMRPIP